MSNSLRASQIRSTLNGWKVRNLNEQAKACNEGYRAFDYIIDLFADTSVEELDDLSLERLVRASTANRLNAFGYTGAQSNSGKNLTPFYTALLHAVKAEFGDEAVRLDVSTYRGILNRTEIREFYSAEAKRLIRRLLTATVSDDSTLTESNRRHIEACRAGTAKGIGQHIFNELMAGVPASQVRGPNGEAVNMNTVHWYTQFAK